MFSIRGVQVAYLMKSRNNERTEKVHVWRTYLHEVIKSTNWYNHANEDRSTVTDDEQRRYNLYSQQYENIFNPAMKLLPKMYIKWSHKSHYIIIMIWNEAHKKRKYLSVKHMQANKAVMQTCEWACKLV